MRRGVRPPARKQRTARKRRHSVKAHLSVFELAKAKCALTLNVFASREKIGTIEIGRGAIYWWGKGRQRSKRISWTRFAEIMDQMAYAR